MTIASLRSALGIATVICASGGTVSFGQQLGPISVLTFDRQLINWATAVERAFDFPDAALPMSKVTMTVELACPPGGCDPWDRSASVFVRGRNALGREETYEIARYITPYGRGCSWEFDVTDYRIFLAGRATLGCFIETFIGGDLGWLVTIRFSFNPGPSLRDVASIENLWRGKPGYGDPGAPINQFFDERTLDMDPAASGAKLRFFVTGHGQGNTENAAEFARKRHSVQVNADRFEHYLWRDDCDQNPCSPQGGTWQFDRAGWCPGSGAAPWDVDISRSATPGEPVTIRYEVEAYTNRCRPTAGCTAADCPGGDCNFNSNGHTPPIYWVESQLITYRSALGGGQTYSFQQNVSGYTGTIDTTLAEASPAIDRSTALDLVVDSDDPGGTRKQTQALLRFDDIFGDAASQIPPGTSIRRAVLQLATRSSGTGAAVHRLLGPWDASAGWSAYGVGGIQSGVEAEKAPDSVVSALSGGVVEVDVTASLNVWSANPCLNHGWAFLPTGTDGWSFDSAEGSRPPTLLVESSPSVDDTLIAVGDAWRYFKGTRAPPADWMQPGFVPGAGWLTGPTGIGYADDDDATVLADMQGKYASVFCRREFPVGAHIASLRLKIDYDDGFAAFLNGTEVARSASLGPPGGPLAWNTLAASSRETGLLEIHEIPTSLVVAGTNVLAIEVHNNTLDSSDLSLLPALVASHALVAPGSRWRFLRGSAPLPPQWKNFDFDDSTWEEGRTGIGYGDGDDVTELLDMQGSYGAVFCRHELLVPKLDEIQVLTLRALYDDGIVVFVNGSEVERINMPAGAVTARLLAQSAVEPQIVTVSIPHSLLVAGRNVIAVSVHNASLDSSDLSFDAVVVESGPPGRADCGSLFRRGDGNGDGSISLTDAVLTLGYLFLGGTPPGCLDSADANDDGALQLADAIYVLQFLFLGGATLPDPAGPDCGTDPTVDPLDCQGAAGCP